MTTKLAVLVHNNDEVTVFDERGVPVLCRDCRFSGWLTEYEFNVAMGKQELPERCLHFSGGADPVDGDRVVFDEIKIRYKGGHTYDSHRDEWKPVPHCHIAVDREHCEKYPLCKDKNHDGKCGDFVRAQPEANLSWWWRLWESKKKRRARLRRMRP